MIPELSPCLPPSFIKSGHAQTLFGFFLPSESLAENGERVEIPLDDGERLVAFIHEGKSKNVIYLFHGLTGTTDSNYMHRTALLAQRRGDTVIRVNHRNCGAGAGLAKAPYHSGRAEDLSSTIAYGKRRYPEHRHLAIGFSLSANALLLLLSGERGSTKPDYAISVNAPINLESSALLLKQGLNRIYDLEFMRLSRRDALRLRKELHLPLFFTMHDFDNYYTAPYGGFHDREDYYRSCSTWERLWKIQTPTIILTADDDPFVDVQFYKKARLSSSVVLHREAHGGHLGYLTRSQEGLKPKRWLDYALATFIAHLLD